MKKVVIVHTTAPDNSPVLKRVEAFRTFYNGAHYSTEIVSLVNYKQFYRFIRTFLKAEILFVTMPDFYNSLWLMLFLPFKKVVVDFRDGWSLGMLHGYEGEGYEVNKLKLGISRAIEKRLVKKSFRFITCTPGLEKYLSDLTNHNILLIPNGIDTDQQLVPFKSLEEKKCLNMVCLGKFESYGIANAKRCLFSISTQLFTNKLNKIVVEVVGDTLSREIVEYAKSINIELKSQPRVSKSEIPSLLLRFDVGIVLLRNADYEFGTKVFEYVANGLPIFNLYPDTPFERYFDGCFYGKVNEGLDRLKFLREESINREAVNLL